jgi:hypothetical protein
LAWLIVKIASFAVIPFARFFAGFCLVANGVYLGMGAWTGDGDAGDLLRAGAQIWHLVLFGISATSCGFGLWHGQGTTFGFNGQQEQITTQAVIAVAGVLAITMTLELIFSPL